MHRQAGFRQGLHAAVPIMLGYLPIAFSFGVAAAQHGFSTAEIGLFSALMYSGAGQFLAIALLAGGVPVAVAAVSLIAMALRHLIYGPALLKAAGPDATTRGAALWGFGLTDEVFGAALGEIARGRVRFSPALMLGLGLGAWGSWVIGSLIGALAGGGALAGWPSVEAGLGFMLPALFLALLLSIMGRAQLPLIVVAGAATVAGTVLASPTTGILAGMVGGALAGAIRLRGVHAA